MYSITLTNSLSHSVKFPGKPETRFYKGRAVLTDDPVMVKYAKDNPSFFAVSKLSSPEREESKQEGPKAVVTRSRMPQRKPVKPIEPSPGDNEPNAA